jgi:antirestriction protein ArdC
MTADEARTFERYSVMNVVQLKASLECECEPYVDIFTFRRWKAQGFSVMRGQKGHKIMTYIKGSKTVKDENGLEKEETFKRPWTSTVFCRCQVQPS